MRAGLAALLGFLDESPQLAHLLVVESLVAGPQALRLREETVGELVSLVKRGAAAAGRRDVGAWDLAGEALVGAALAILHRRLLYDAQHRRSGALTDGPRKPGAARRTDGQRQDLTMREPVPPVGRLSELQAPLMSMIVLCHVGTAAARKELERPVISPHSPNDPWAATDGVLAARGVRLTDRTILVLSAIATLSRAGGGPSNREVARAAGIADQGQTSKLLSRLCRQGLIENAPMEVQLRANAWRLTPDGEAVVRSLPEEA
jgi:DNA-binding MarR family transcriptional regulator